MKPQTLVNLSTRSWDRLNRGAVEREDIHREACYWAVRLILGAVQEEGVQLKGDPKGIPLGVLCSEHGTLRADLENDDLWEVYEFFYTYLTTGIQMDHECTYRFVKYMREHVDVILNMRYPPGGFVDARTSELIVKLFIGGTQWKTTPELKMLWNIDYQSLTLHPFQFVLWNRHAPTLIDMLNGFDGLFNRLVGLPANPAAHATLLAEYGHDFNYPYYDVPKPEGLKMGIGLRIHNLYLFPNQDLVAKAAACVLDAEGSFTAIIPELKMATQYEVSRITERSYRVDLCVSVADSGWPRWVLEAFPDKQDKLR